MQATKQQRLYRGKALPQHDADTVVDGRISGAYDSRTVTDALALQHLQERLRAGEGRGHCWSVAGLDLLQWAGACR